MRGFLKKYKVIALVLIIAFLLRIILTPFGTLETPDMNNFRAWGDHMVNKGPGEFYDTIWADYTPGYLYILWALSAIKNLFGIEERLVWLMLYKLPAIFADIGAGLLIFLAVSRFNKKFAVAAASLYLFNPAVFANSAMWGQVDGLTGFFALAAVFFSTSHPLITAFSLAFGTSMKVPVGFVAPLVAVLWIRTYGWWKTIKYTIITAALFVASLSGCVSQCVFLSLSVGHSLFLSVCVCFSLCVSLCVCFLVCLCLSVSV